MSLLNQACSSIWAMDKHSYDQMLNFISRINLSPEQAELLMAERLKRFSASTGLTPAFKAVQAEAGERVEGTRNARLRNDNTAIIPVIGPIVRRADFFSEFSGATSIESMSQDFNALLANDKISTIVHYIDSGGGEVDGINEYANMVYKARGRKQIEAYAAYLCGSGAYWIASACSRITADRTAIIGSVGVIATIMDASAAETLAGINRTYIVNEDSPDKKFDPKNPVSVQRVQKQVNDMAAVFFDTLARNRGLTVEQVKADFGRGDTMLAEAALAARMIDAVGSFEEGLVSTEKPEDLELPLAASANSGIILVSDKGDSIMADEKGKSIWSRFFGTMSAEEKAQAKAELLAESQPPGNNPPANPPPVNPSNPPASNPPVGNPPPANPPATNPAEASAYGSSGFDYKSRVEQLEREARDNKIASIKAAATGFYKDQLHANRVQPTQQAATERDYIRAATDDWLYPLPANEQSRVAALNETYASMPSHRFTSNIVKSENLKIAGGEQDVDPLKAADERAEKFANEVNARGRNSYPRSA